MPRHQLPPQIKKITLKNGKVRYHVKENGRVDSITKQRPKLDKRFDSEKEARDTLRDFQYQTARGTYVMRSTLTVEQACANWLAGRHGLRKSAKAAYRNGLQPLRDRHGGMPRFSAVFSGLVRLGLILVSSGGGCVDRRGVGDGG